MSRTSVARITTGLCLGTPNAFASSSRVLLRPGAAPPHIRAPRTILVVRLASTTSTPPPDHDDRPQARTRGKNHRCVEGMSDGQRRAYYQLRPVVDAFKAPVDLAIAYGSGVVAQANAAPGPPPLTDFIISTPSAYAFHSANLKQFPEHYPLYARLLGPGVVAWLTDNLGAGMWYVTMVKFGELEVKYGVISTPTLQRDLTDWTTLYVSGRLHKPVLGLSCTPQLRAPLTSNVRSALAFALLQLPPSTPFSELQLYEAIAGISYSGDPRMAVPGAENPEKVRNIVRGPGVLEGFRALYGPFFASAGEGVRWAGEKGKGLREWRGQGEELMSQPATERHYAKLAASLPLTLRQAVAAHYRPTVVGSMVDKDVAADRVALKGVAAAGLALHDDPAFWAKVVSQDTFRDTLAGEVRHIIRRPALTQSVKGIMTAGFVKSVVYSVAKFRKWWAAKQKQRSSGSGEKK